MFDYWPVTAPYPGLRTFEPHEGEIFFGRDGHTDRLLEILQRERFLAVIGPSGCGKSSLVRAGLLPALAAGRLGTGSHWRLALLRPGGQPLLALAQALLGRHALGEEILGDEARAARADGLEAATVDDATPDAALVAAELRSGMPGFMRLLAHVQERRKATTARAGTHGSPARLNLLVLVDQFEELFTYRDADADPAEATQFIDLLLALRGLEAAGVRVCLALTMRTDFLGHCVAHAELPEAINRAQYLTPRLKTEEMRAAICGPARIFGGEVDAAFADEIIDRVGSNSDQLPLLQHALARWWREAGQSGDGELRIAAALTARVGDVEQALDRHAEEVFGAMPANEQAAAEALFRAITAGREGAEAAVRRPQRLGDIAAWTGLDATLLGTVIRRLAAADVSFVHHGRDLTGSTVVDLTHEALMRQWSRLKGWVDDELRRGMGWRRWQAHAADHALEQVEPLSGVALARALEWWNPGNEDTRPWQPTPRWAKRYSSASDDAALAAEFEQLRRFLLDSRDAELRRREDRQLQLKREAEEAHRRADQERALAQQAHASAAHARRWTQVAGCIAVLAVLTAAFGWYQYRHAQKTEQARTSGLFDLQLTHASLLAHDGDYAEARRVLAETTRLDAQIPLERQHARNLLAGHVRAAGGQSDMAYGGAGAALVGGVATSPDGKLLAAAGERGTLVIFDAETGQLLRRLVGHDGKAGTTGSVRGIAFHPRGDSLYSGGEDGRIIRWSVESGRKLAEWNIGGTVQGIAIRPDGRQLATGGEDGAITLWALPEGKRGRQLIGHTGAINGSSKSLAYSPDGKHLASASSDQTARVWNVETGKSAAPIRGHTTYVSCVAFSNDGRLLATASGDRRIMLWGADDGSFKRELIGHQGDVYGVAFSDDDRQLLSTSRDITLRLWDVSTGVTRRVYQGHSGGLVSVAVRGDRFYTAANDGMVRQWTLEMPEQWIWAESEPATAAAIAPNGRWAAVGFESGALRFYAMPQGKLLGTIDRAHEDWVLRLAFSQDGKLLATAGRDSKAALWEVGEADGGPPSLRRRHTITQHGSVVYDAAFSPDGLRLATASYDGTIGLFNAATGSGRTVPAHEGPALGVAFDPTGRWLLSAGDSDFLLRLWDTQDLDRKPRELARLRDTPMSASLSPDGRELVAVGREQAITLLDLARPDRPRHLSGHQDAVHRARYSPDGRQLATVSGDLTLRLWDLYSQRLLLTQRLPGTWERGNSPLWDFDFRCAPGAGCRFIVPLTMGRVVVYQLPYETMPTQ